MLQLPEDFQHLVECVCVVRRCSHGFLQLIELLARMHDIRKDRLHFFVQRAAGERCPFLRQISDGDVFCPCHFTGIRSDVAQKDPQERGFP